MDANAWNAQFQCPPIDMGPSIFDSSINFDALPALGPTFSIESLDFVDERKNPIVERLRRYESSLEGSEVEQSEVASQASRNEVVQDELSQPAEATRKSRILSWENFYKPPTQPQPSPFLTEQPPHISATLREQALLPEDGKDRKVGFIRAEDLIATLPSTLVGGSSEIFIWNQDEEKLNIVGDNGDSSVDIFLDYLDRVLSRNIVKTFSEIGTLFRRVEGVAEKLQQSPDGGVTRSCGFALSSVLDYMRAEVDSQPPFSPSHLAELSAYHEPKLAMLQELSDFCRCPIETSPPYLSLPTPDDELLSYIYGRLESAVHHASPMQIQATMAYILSTSSSEYLGLVRRLLGLSSNETPILHLDTVDVREDDDDGIMHIILTSEKDAQDHRYPEFFTPELQAALTAGRRSLAILRTARPNHELLIEAPGESSVRWPWEAIPDTDCQKDESARSPIATHGYPLELDVFKVFDQRPDFHPPAYASDERQQIHTGASHRFSTTLTSYPDSFPLFSPTLPLVTEHMLSALKLRATTLSNALLSLYISPSELDLTSHLRVLRSFLLMTSARFQARLSVALFADYDDTLNTLSPFLSRRSRGKKKRKNGELSGIGLAPGLLESGKWPPRGSSLSYHLRSVIMDTLEGQADGSAAWKQAESRVGFTIVDPPDKDTEIRWQDPSSLEALDFLALQYRPPPTLSIVLSQDVLTKYGRVFTFLLRLLRVNAVVRYITQRTLKAQNPPLFEYDRATFNLLEQLRFRVHAFQSSLTTYVFDFAIRVNFDSFLAQVSSVLSPKGSDEGLASAGRDIGDIFALAARHSQMLDRIMNLCVLRQRQSRISRILNSLFDTILRFGKLLDDLDKTRSTEVLAADELRVISQDFDQAMLNLVKALVTETGKGATNETTFEGLSARAQSDLRALLNSEKADGGGTLADLLARIDLDGSWRDRVQGPISG
ncbi:hypothetical protein SISSUDRAFT_1042629 [Sistotremastrum suecicum HHB10207 ss-3]|uniref:Spindle pole body component n=1 Tax=Sistotremastrum suecicum HHB10207 ss-3 TaxID=1314776 RepID=A0A166GDB0_9AGAM|nr:hypothetical protein SISSUDRAFT_1042629 [Sistotremastrum suecicum HHB10207 ss-3]